MDKNFIDTQLALFKTLEEKLKWMIENCEDGYPMILKRHHELNDELERRVSNLTSDGFTYKTSTKIFWVLNGIESWLDKRVHCKECDSELHGKNVGSIKAMDYPCFCCRSCQVKNKDTQAKIMATCLDTYGVEYSFQSEEIKAKTKSTNLKNCGAEWFIGSKIGRQKSAETKAKKYGNPNYVNPDKREQTLLEKTGYANPFSNPKVIAKMVEKKKASGDYGNHKKSKQTRLERNGGRYKSDEELKQYVQTSMQKFGVPNPMQSEEVKDYLKRCNVESFGYEWPGQCPDIQAKQRQRYSWNGIKFDSAPELAFYIWMLDHNVEFEYQPSTPFEYFIDGTKYFYCPDFKVGDQFYEIKGDQFFKEDGTMFLPYRKKSWSDADYERMCAKYQAKHQCMLANNVIILTSKDYQQYLDYVSEKYGKNYLKSFKT